MHNSVSSPRSRRDAAWSSWALSARQAISVLPGQLAAALTDNSRSQAENAATANATCAIAAATLWLVCFYFAEEIRYVRDDFHVLVPVLHGGLAQSLQQYVRPLEYAIALASIRSGYPLWLAVSFAAYVCTSLATLSLWRMIAGLARIPTWQVLICAATPLMTNTYFQIDTVSQALANWFSLLLAIAVLSCIRATSASVIASRAWLVAGAAVLCLLSKETSYGLVGGAGVLLCLAHGRRVLGQVLFMACALAACLVWSSLYTFDISPGEHYGLKNPLYWAFAVVFSAAVAVVPTPTSLLLTGTAAEHGGYLLLVVTGLVVALVGLVAFAWRAVRALRERIPSSATRLQPIPAVLLLLFMFSLMPSIFFKASELYASQSVPFLKCLLLWPYRVSASKRVPAYAVTVAVLWALASVVNVMFYSVETGYRPSKEGATSLLQRPVAALEPVVAKQRASYSIYSMEGNAQVLGDCLIERRDRSICLPQNITSGVPRLAPR
jgi:hypothetical protein